MRLEEFKENSPEEVVKKYPEPMKIKEHAVYGVNHLLSILQENPDAINDDKMQKAMEHFSGTSHQEICNIYNGKGKSSDDHLDSLDSIIKVWLIVSLRKAYFENGKFRIVK